MKYKYSLLKVSAIGCFITFSFNTSFAGYPPAYYNQAPNYNQQQGYDQQQDYNQQRTYSIESRENDDIAPNAPPSPQQEYIIPAPTPAHAWIPGYWNWQNRWVWIPGQWVQPPRPNAEWREHQWRHHEDGERYRMERGEWR
jgi:hypothetical protein